MSFAAVFISSLGILHAQPLAVFWEATKNMGAGWGSHEIAFGTNGECYMVWNWVGVNFSRSFDGGKTWSETMSNIGQIITDGNPAIALNSSKSLFVCYESQVSGINQIYLIKSSDQGSTWSPPIRVATTSNNSSSSRILIDSRDALHVLWLDRSGPTMDQVTFFHTVSSDGGTTWSSPDLIASGYNTPSFEAKIDSGDRLYAFLRFRLNQLEGDALFCYRSTDYGAHWSASRVEELGSPDQMAAPWGFSGTIDKNGIIHITYGETVAGGELSAGKTNNVKYANSADHGNTWGNYKVIATTVAGIWTMTPAFWSSISAGPGHDLVAAFQSRNSGRFDIYTLYSRDSGSTWTSPEKRAHGSGELLIPTVVISPTSTIHLLWNELFTTITNDEPAQLLYYNRGSIPVVPTITSISLTESTVCLRLNVPAANYVVEQSSDFTQSFQYCVSSPAVATNVVEFPRSQNALNFYRLRFDHNTLYP